MGTMYTCAELDPLSHFKRLQMEILFSSFTEGDWSRECCHGNNCSRCYYVSFVMYISGAKFEEHCSNISGDILD